VASSETKPVVVLIDDSIDVHRLLKARLKSEPIELVAFDNGQAAIEFCNKQPPALIMCDLDMPVLDGFGVIRALKSQGSTVNTPIIVLSGITESQDKVQAFDLGANDYVTKPFDFAELRARLRSALRLNRLLTLLAERAEVDGLTGLGNRAAFNRRWAQEVHESQRYARPLALAVMDIDHFKRINDTYGHPAGDEVIQGFAAIVQKCIRDCDIACRYGGEEFCVIMPETGPDDAKIVAERIRTAMAAMTWPKHPDHKVTCSLGIAGSTSGGTSFTAEQWLERADKALYSAKHGGRNKTVVDNMVAPSSPLKMAG
jgi:two-component system, cell cycle response regulator